MAAEGARSAGSSAQADRQHSKWALTLPGDDHIQLGLGLCIGREAVCWWQGRNWRCAADTPLLCCRQLPLLHVHVQRVRQTLTDFGLGLRDELRLQDGLGLCNAAQRRAGQRAPRRGRGWPPAVLGLVKHA